MRAFLLLLAAGLLTTAVTSAQSAPTAAELASRIQAHNSSIRDFTAEFTLTQTNPLLPRPVVERGDVKVKKPGRMRWQYASNDKKLFVADGNSYYAYSPQDRVVYVQKLPSGADTSTSLMFLAGQVNLARDFVPSVPATQPAAEWHLVLKPKAAQADFQTLTLEVDRMTLALLGAVVVDDQGAVSKFRFSRLQTNRNLPDTDFVFTMPRNVEVRRQ